MDVKPFIQNSRTFVPIRFISEALDGEVDWDNATKKRVLVPVCIHFKCNK